MNGTEKMQGTVESTATSHADDELVGVAGSSATDQRRRRLIRGAAAAVPVVLTLRSGALAAASCTGAEWRGLTGNNGQVPSDSPNNVCAVLPQTDACPTNKIAGATNFVPLGMENNNGSTTYYCGSKNQFKRTDVAILSCYSASSLVGGLNCSANGAAGGVSMATPDEIPLITTDYNPLTTTSSTGTTGTSSASTTTTSSTTTSGTALREPTFFLK